MVKAKPAKKQKAKSKPKPKSKPKAKVKSKKAKTASPKPKKKTKSAVADSGGVAAAPAGLVDVTMTIEFPGGPPSEAQTIRRIDSKALPTGKAKLNHGAHTAGWNVISPIVRPVAYAVKIVEDLTGKVLLNRPNEQTGADGNGQGADEFGV